MKKSILEQAAERKLTRAKKSEAKAVKAAKAKLASAEKAAVKKAAAVAKARDKALASVAVESKDPFRHVVLKSLNKAIRNSFSSAINKVEALRDRKKKLRAEIAARAYRGKKPTTAQTRSLNSINHQLHKTNNTISTAMNKAVASGGEVVRYEYAGNGSLRHIKTNKRFDMNTIPLGDVVAKVILHVEDYKLKSDHAEIGSIRSFGLTDMGDGKTGFEQLEERLGLSLANGDFEVIAATEYHIVNL